MPSSVLEIVSLAEMKDELRIPAEETDHDTLITYQLEAALSYVEREISTPIIDTTEIYYATRRAADRPIRVLARHIRSVSRVRLWDATDDFRDEPSQTINLATLGRKAYNRDKSVYYIYPPESGWPEVLKRTAIEVQVVRGTDPVPQAIKQTIILWCREFYDGRHEVKPTAAMHALLRPFQRLVP